MPKLDLPPPIPDWLKPVLKRSISGEAKPDTMDFQVVSAALAGVELDALKKRFDLGAGGVPWPGQYKRQIPDFAERNAGSLAPGRIAPADQADPLLE